ncbi:hypothetical protein H696_06283 [Fonticula alba]|uniref:Uncharacterized protein n=1 Tax=Fonticula alba TaxID=691883 RepID=A0A058Z183_FONAL|nr:hypothetical protein H696_06283 [Fonticula alba]KCV67297.1 hypothetical protein H696_06283 [Fonticula alba]|eukprot:XP_009498298.1 hypothetical protein H696_06283 [Fonticula alba]
MAMADLGAWATGFALPRLPSMPELRQKPVQFNAPIHYNELENVPFKDKARERKRLAELAKADPSAAARATQQAGEKKRAGTANAGAAEPPAKRARPEAEHEAERPRSGRQRLEAAHQPSDDEGPSGARTQSCSDSDSDDDGSGAGQDFDSISSFDKLGNVFGAVPATKGAATGGRAGAAPLTENPPHGSGRQLSRARLADMAKSGIRPSTPWSDQIIRKQRQKDRQEKCVALVDGPPCPALPPFRGPLLPTSIYLGVSV